MLNILLGTRRVEDSLFLCDIMQENIVYQRRRIKGQNKYVRIDRNAKATVCSFLQYAYVKYTHEHIKLEDRFRKGTTAKEITMILKRSLSSTYKLLERLKRAGYIEEIGHVKKAKRLDIGYLTGTIYPTGRGRGRPIKIWGLKENVKKINGKFYKTKER